MIISQYFCLFIIYSCMGWIYETILSIFKNGAWENRGFLYGPICPIYGVGCIAVSFMMNLNYVELFVISVIGSAILEYATSWFLEKMFHAVWWDYHDLPFNLHGRISLFTSLGFGVAGVLVVKYLIPFVEGIIDPARPLAMEAAALLIMAVFAMDLTLTVSFLIHFDRIVVHADEQFNKNMEELVSSTVQKSTQIRQNILARQKEINNRIGMMGNMGKGALRRIKSFSYQEYPHVDEILSGLKHKKPENEA